MTLDQKKIRLIEEIVRNERADVLEAVGSVLARFRDSGRASASLPKLDLSKHRNISGEFDFEALRRRRPQGRIDMHAFARQADELEWEQSVEELISDLD